MKIGRQKSPQPPMIPFSTIGLLPAWLTFSEITRGIPPKISLVRLNSAPPHFGQSRYSMIMDPVGLSISKY